jgi:CubicO group peptidase (beta-lactamase class C family)
MKKALQLLLVCLLVSFAITRASAQERQLPSSPTGQALGALLDVIESGDRAAIESLVESRFDDAFRNNFVMDDHVRMFTQLHRDLHPFDIVGVKKTGPHSAECILKGMETGMSIRIEYSLEADPPHRFNGLGFSPAPPEDAGFSSLDDVDATLRRRANEGTFSGVVLAARSGEVVFHEAYGEASKRSEDPNALDTRFNIGSLNKMFTGVAVLQLAESGLLKLDDKIGLYFDGFPAGVAESVSIRHLLQHSAGWGAYWDNEYYINNWRRLRSISDYLEFIRDIPLDFEPGTSRQYSNTGYEVLGAIIEAVSGMDYYEYIREHVYAPAGMKDSDSFESDAVAPRIATGYMRGRGAEAQLRENTLHKPVRGTAAGGGFSTAEDLFRFVRALRGGKLLSTANTNLFWGRFGQDAVDQAPTGGLGFGGGAPGINAVVEVDFDSDLTVIVVSNYDPPTAAELGPVILDVLR